MNSTLIAVAILVAAPAAKSPPKEAAPSIIGHWIVESDVNDGKAEAVTSGTTMTFEKQGKAFMKEGEDDETAELEYTLDASQMPGHLDLLEGRALGNQKHVCCIYKIEGNTLTICLAMKGNRPAEFASPAGSKYILLTLKRAKKD